MNEIAALQTRRNADALHTTLLARAVDAASMRLECANKLEFVEQLTSRQWNELSLNAGVAMPDQRIRNAVIAVIAASQQSADDPFAGL